MFHFLLFIPHLTGSKTSTSGIRGTKKSRWGITESQMFDWLFLPIHVSALLGGSIVGVGAGILFRVGVATEGFAQVVKSLTRWNVGIILFVLDAAILVFGLTIIGFEAFFNSLLAVSAVGFFFFHSDT